MENAIFVAVSIVVAAVIGYITNYLAIKMLFLPRREWRVWGKRVPFTPGLIPKRKGEIAASLGRVVSDYLVTADGLKEVLQQPELRGQVERKLRELVESWAERDETLEEVAARLLGPEQAESAKRTLEQLAERIIMDGVRGLWSDAMTRNLAMSQESSTGEALAIGGADTVDSSFGDEPRGGDALLEAGIGSRGGGSAGAVETGASGERGDSDGRSEAVGTLSDGTSGEAVALGLADDMQANHVATYGKLPIMQRPLSELLDQLKLPVDDLLTREAVPWIVQALRAELSSTNGLLIIHRIVTQMLGNLGGMMGMLAGMFVDEDKITRKVRDALLNYLASPAANDMLGGLLMKQKDRLGEMTPAELLGKLRHRLELTTSSPSTDGDPATSSQDPLSDAEWFAGYVNHQVPWRGWVNRIWEMTPRQLLASRKEQLLGMTPLIAERLMNLVSDRIDQAVRTLNLSKLVQKQVEDFPMDQVEEVILSITGREFKAITWLGALLGGIIGILQALFYLWMDI